MSQKETIMEVRDYKGDIALHIVGDKCYDTHGRWVYAINGNYICNSTGHWVYEIRGDRIYDTQGNWVYQICHDQHHIHSEVSHEPSHATPLTNDNSVRLENREYSSASSAEGKAGSELFRNSTNHASHFNTTNSPQNSSHISNINTTASTRNLSHAHHADATTPRNFGITKPSKMKQTPIIIAAIAIVILIGFGVFLLRGGDNGTGNLDSGISGYQTGGYEVGQVLDEDTYGYETGSEQTEDTEITPETPMQQDGPATFGSTFQFDGSSGQIEVTFGTETFWGRIDNSWSQHYGSTIFAIPVIIRNISSETGGLNLFDIALFAPDGLNIDPIGTLFDYDIKWESNMRAGASQTGLLYFLYDGDGEYAVEFSAAFGFGFGDFRKATFHVEYTSYPSLSDFDINLFPPSTFTPLPIDGAFTLGDTFTFNGSSGVIEISLGTDISWVAIDNTLSHRYGATVFAVPISITNAGAETGSFNPVDLTLFGSNGLALPSVGSYFGGDITWEGSIMAGAMQEGYLFFLYVGDGQYAIELTAGFGLGDFVEVIFSITR